MRADTSAVSLAFQRWLKANGVVLGGEVELSRIDIEGGGGNVDGSRGDGGGESDRRPRPAHRLRRRRRTVLSTASSAPGALIARVPDSTVLTVSSSSAAEALEAAGLGNSNSGAGGGGKRESPWKEAAGLALALLVESRLGEGSRFAPYVRWLLSEGESESESEDEDDDQETPHPVTWDPRAAAVLFSGTAVAPRLLRLPSSSSGDGNASGGGGLHAPSAVPLAWSRLARPWLLSRYGMTEERKKSGKGGARTLRAEFFRCLAVVSSHAFVLGDDRILALVPVFDALDHAPGPARVRLSHSGGGGAGGDDPDADGDGDGGGDEGGDGDEEGGEKGGFLEMRSTVPLSRGEEVFNSYGRLSTAALARRYGFAPGLAGDGGGREAMLRSGDEKLEVRAGEVGVAAAAIAAGSSPTLSRRRRTLRAPAACLRAAAASRGRPLFVSVPSGEPSLGLLLAVRASLPLANDADEEEGQRVSLVLLEGRTLLEVARRRRAALEAGGARAARALAKLGKKRKRSQGGKKDGSSGIVFPPASGFELADAVRRSELEGCACLESWVRRRMLL